jgi:hypothetical protein
LYFALTRLLRWSPLLLQHPVSGARDTKRLNENKASQLTCSEEILS